MDATILFYAAAVAWFSYGVFFVAGLVFQYVTYPRTFGSVTNISLRDLAELAVARRTELPSFKIVVPAFQEQLVIEDTVRRLCALNFPRTHFDIHVVTYEDEPPDPNNGSTWSIARRVADEINAVAGRTLVSPLLVPQGYDGYFPGCLDATVRHIGKARGLNFALRTIHEHNERDERAYYIGRMSRQGHLQRLDQALAMASRALVDRQDEPRAIVERLFDPSDDEFVGPATLSSQLETALGIVAGVTEQDITNCAPARRLLAYVETEAPRFFMELRCPTMRRPSGQRVEPAVRADREFLYCVMRQVEARGHAVLALESIDREATLKHERPVLYDQLANARDGEQIYQLTRRINSRWLAVYDADADVPADLFRHLAARILTEPAAMGFQGPVAPVANFNAVSPVCRLGGLWMGFWHCTGYPRLMSLEHWAHPLAGTNWCFRIEGIARDGRLRRDCPYDEGRRHFVMSFDPKQLTEDLEVGVRNYSDWHLNAEWHPYVEHEQVPPSARAMIVQRTRWTLGTLQTVNYILHSRVPLLQKAKYALLPLDIVVSGTGPLVTIALWILVVSGDLVNSTPMIVWSIILTLFNAVYVLPYLLAYNRIVGDCRRNAAMDHLLLQGPALIDEIDRKLRRRMLTPQESRRVRGIADQLKGAMEQGGLIAEYLAVRCVDEFAPGEDVRSREDILTANLRNETPTALYPDRLRGLVDAFVRIDHEIRAGADKIDFSGATAADQPDQRSDRVEPDTRPTAPQHDIDQRLLHLGDLLAMATASGRWRAVRRRERIQVCLWALPYLFFQLVPYYRGLIVWLTRGRQTQWHKTPRTCKGGRTERLSRSVGH